MTPRRDRYGEVADDDATPPRQRSRAEWIRELRRIIREKEQDMPTTFAAWLAKQLDRDDPVGDIARELEHDKCAPHTTAAASQPISEAFRRGVDEPRNHRYMPRPRPEPRYSRPASIHGLI